MKKELTYNEFMELALKNYSKGGDSYYECWEDYQFNDYVKEFGAITEARALEMFSRNYDIEQDVDNFIDWASGTEKEPEEEAETEEPLYDRIYNKLFDYAETESNYDAIMGHIKEDLSLDEDTFQKVYEDFRLEFELWTETKDTGFYEEEYSPSAPWNAPGMKISDFISGVYY